MSKKKALLALETSFGQGSSSYRISTGFFVEPRLIVTAAHVVGLIDTSCNESRRIIHKSCIGATVAPPQENTLGTVVKTTPLAVSFATDVAVLKVVMNDDDDEEEEEKKTPLSPICLVVGDHLPDKWDTLFNISCSPEMDYMKYRTVRAVGGNKMERVKAPWPLDDELRWIELGRFMVRCDPPPPPPVLQCRGKLTGVFSTVESPWINKDGKVINCEDKVIAGSPWINRDRKVVGLASWEVASNEPLDDTALCRTNFAVPSVCIKAVLEYAKTKGPEDPIVMDSWIDDSREIPGGVAEPDVETNMSWLPWLRGGGN